MNANDRTIGGRLAAALFALALGGTVLLGALAPAVAQVRIAQPIDHLAIRA
jgi:hypothetical protein